MFMCTFLSLNGLKTLVIRGWHNMMLVTPWPSKQHMIGRLTIDDINMIGFSKRSYCQIDIDIPKY